MTDPVLPQIESNDARRLGCRRRNIRGSLWLLVALLGYSFFTCIYIFLLGVMFMANQFGAMPIIGPTAAVGIATVGAVAMRWRHAHWLVGLFLFLNLVAFLLLLNGMGNKDPST